MTKPLVLAGIVLALASATFAVRQFQPTPAKPVASPETTVNAAMVAGKQPAAHSELAQLGKRAFEATCAACRVVSVAGGAGGLKGALAQLRKFPVRRGVLRGDHGSDDCGVWAGVWPGRRRLKLVAGGGGTAWR